MKIQILSDTHKNKYILDPEADVIVHAGDFGNGFYEMQRFADLCKEQGKEYVAVLGNHDYYSHDIYQVFGYLNKNKHLNILTHNKTITIKGYTFVGGTLFTNFRHNSVTDLLEYEKNKQLAASNIYDFIAIRSGAGFVTPDEYHYLFKKTLKNIMKHKNKEKVVVVTHFPPSLSCIAPQYLGNALNPYFINDIDVSGFTTWISGHTHTAVDTVENGCRLLVNPLGYPHEHGSNGFNPNLIIDLP